MPLFKTIKGKDVNCIAVSNLFFLYLVESTNLSVNTRLSYRHHIDKLLDKLDAKNPVLRCRDIENFLKKKTINAHSAIKKFLIFIEEEFNSRFIQIKYPDIKKSEKKVIEVISVSQVNSIISEMPDYLKFPTKFMYHCALRIGELFRLRVDSIDWDKHKLDKTQYANLKISHTKSKRERIIPLSPSFVKEIDDYIKDNNIIYEDDFLLQFNQKEYLEIKERQNIKKKVGFKLNLSDNDKALFREERSWSMLIRSKSVRFQKEFRQASFKALKKYYSPHVLRRSRATEMLNAGLNIMAVRDLLGHSDISTTQNYLTISADQLSKDMNRLGL